MVAIDVRDICLSFKDSRIHYVARQPERRMTDNWNFVTHWAGDGLVALLEDDNIWEVDHLAHAEQLWARFPESGIYHAGHREAWDDNGHLEFYRVHVPVWHARLAGDGGGVVEPLDVC